jgi:hypothetical protein
VALGGWDQEEVATFASLLQRFNLAVEDLNGLVWDRT